MIQIAAVWLLTRRKLNFCYQLQVSSIYQWSLGPGRQSLNDTIDFLKLSMANWARINCYWQIRPLNQLLLDSGHTIPFLACYWLCHVALSESQWKLFCVFILILLLYVLAAVLFVFMILSDVIVFPYIFLESAMWLFFGGSTQVLLTGGKVQHYSHNERRLR